MTIDRSSVILAITEIGIARQDEIVARGQLVNFGLTGYTACFLIVGVFRIVAVLGQYDGILMLVLGLAGSDVIFEDTCGLAVL